MTISPGRDLQKNSNPVRATYEELRAWYQANAAQLLEQTPAKSPRTAAISKSLPLILALPPETELSDLEVRVVLFQVTGGTLNWSYWDRVRGRTAFERVATALEQAGLSKELSPAERREFRESESKLKALLPNL